MESIDWKKLLSTARMATGEGNRKKSFHKLYGSSDHRLDHEKDFDRIVFSTPVRRLQDKTQVFPLDQHDSVRTRLTHSLEVANIARTLATQLVDRLGLSDIEDIHAPRAVPALASAIAIAHDIGNPPFGHQGEAAIRIWVEKKAKDFSGPTTSKRDQDLLSDYRYFDGNPQGFRLMTRLQGVTQCGMILTASTLRASLKYPWSATSDKVDPKKPKFGFFATEKKIFDWASKVVGLKEGERHPLASIMEASDDICYSILDVEDGVKKELVSTSHLISFLEYSSKNSPAKEWISQISKQYSQDVEWIYDNGIKGRYAEDVLMQILRSYFISLAVSVAVPALESSIRGKGYLTSNPCLEHVECSALLSELKKYTKEFIYSHSSVERIELFGHKVIPYLLSAFWRALEATEKKEATKLDAYVVKKISQNYYRVYETTKEKFPSWYARLQVCCDMVCGMTDSYAMNLFEEFKRLEIE